LSVLAFLARLSAYFIFENISPLDYWLPYLSITCEMLPQDSVPLRKVYWTWNFLWGDAPW
jgi:hypothetical protein